MESAAAILPDVGRHWEEPAKAGTPNLSILEAPVAARELAVVVTPVRVRGRSLLARFGPPIVFALALAGIIWLWPPF